MSLTVELIDRIEKAVAFYGAGRPIPAAEAHERLKALGVTVHEDYVEFLGRWGGCFVGVTVQAWDNNALLGKATCIELTTWAREGFGDVIDGVVIADDGAGNPIWIAKDGTVRLADHDNGDVDILAITFSAFLAANVHD